MSPPADLGGGPSFASGGALAQRKGRSGFGPQANSRKTTAPIFSYGHSTRDQTKKVFISDAHQQERKCMEGPGPIYEFPSSMATQADAMKETAPQYSFSKTDRLKSSDSWVPGPGSYVRPASMGAQVASQKVNSPNIRFSTTTRDQQGKRFISSEHVSTIKGTFGAPPGAYQYTDSIGLQPSSLRRSSPAFSIPRVERMKNKAMELSKSMPAVGSYELSGSLGTQTLSKARTVPSYGFGSSSRMTENRRFMSAGHTAKNTMGTFSPGHYNNQKDNNFTSLGRQGLSHRCTSPTMKFGSAMKMVTKYNDTPGPGSYD